MSFHQFFLDLPGLYIIVFELLIMYSHVIIHRTAAAALFPSSPSLASFLHWKTACDNNVCVLTLIFFH